MTAISDLIFGPEISFFDFLTKLLKTGHGTSRDYYNETRRSELFWF